jgi:hypothetical protein
MSAPQMGGGGFLRNIGRAVAAMRRTETLPAREFFVQFATTQNEQQV